MFLINLKSPEDLILAVEFGIVFSCLNLQLILFNYDIVMRQDLFDDLNDLHDNIKKVIDTGNNYD